MCAMPKKEPTKVVRIPVAISDAVLYIKKIYEETDKKSYGELEEFILEQQMSNSTENM